jgi:hypothetical protein
MQTRFSSSSFDRPRATEQDARIALAALQRSGKAVLLLRKMRAEANGEGKVITAMARARTGRRGFGSTSDGLA